MSSVPGKKRCHLNGLQSVFTSGFFLIAAVIMLSYSQPAHSQRPANPLPGGQQRPIQQSVPNEYLVTVKAGSGESEARAALASLGIREISRVSERLFLLKIARDPGLAEVQKLIKSAPGIEAVQPNFIYTINQPGSGAQ